MEELRKERTSKEVLPIELRERWKRIYFEKFPPNVGIPNAQVQKMLELYDEALTSAESVSKQKLSKQVTEEEYRKFVFDIAKQVLDDFDESTYICNEIFSHYILIPKEQ